MKTCKKLADQIDGIWKKHENILINESLVIKIIFSANHGRLHPVIQGPALAG